MNSMKSFFIFICLVLVLLMTLQTQAASSTYNFNSLSTGSLVGQDNWGWILGDNLEVGTGSGTNTSLVAVNPGTNPNEANWTYRQNDSYFSIPTFTGNESYWYLEADFYANRNDPKASFYYYIGENSTGNISPWMGMAVPTVGGDYSFWFRGAGFGTGTYVTVPVSINDGDWVRMRLVMEFTGSNGQGIGDTYYMNLTQGDTGFTAISGLQDMDLLNGALNTIDPAAWDSMYIRSDRDNSSALDNLTVFVPEPISSALFIAGGATLAFRRYRIRNIKK